MSKTIFGLSRSFVFALTPFWLLAVHASLALADGWMGQVVGTGKIMDGNTFLKEVPAGTRLWVFRQEDNRYEVKIPGREEHGWISSKALDNIFDGSQESNAIIDDINKQLAAGEALFKEKKYAAALAVRTVLLGKLLRHYGSDHPFTGKFYSDLATTYFQQADYAQAKAHYELALVNLRAAYGNLNSTTSSVLKDYGRMLRETRQLTAAKKTLQEALLNYRGLQDNHDAAIAGVIQELGNVAHDQGDVRAALKLYDEALTIWRKDIDQHAEDILFTLGNRGKACVRGRDFKQAEENFQEALALAKKKFGENHDRTVAAIGSLALLACEQLDRQKGRKLYEEALALNRQIHVAQPDETTAECQSNLGSVLSSLGELTAAQKHYEEALALRRKLQGNEHPSTAHALVQLGNVFNDQDDYAAAKRCYDEALAIRRKVLGNKHPDTGLVLNKLGNLAHAQSDFPTARKYFNEALALFRQKDLEYEHANTAASLVNLGSLAHKNGDYQAARRVFDEALGIYRKELSGDQAAIASLLHDLGDLTRDQGETAAAKKFFEEALAIQRKVLGNEDTETARTLNCLGGMICDEGNFNTGRKHLEEALAIYRKLYGEGNDRLSYTLIHLGKLAYLQKDYRAAWKYNEEALRIQQRIYGKDHPHTVDSLYSLAILGMIEGDDAVAQRNFDDIRRIKRRYARYLLPTLTATEQLQYLENVYRGAWQNSLLYGILRRDDATVASLSTAWVINGKSIGDEALAARELLTRDMSNPQLAPLVLELQEVRQLLGSQALAAVKPEQAAAHQAKLTELAAREFKLARQLSDATGEVFVDVEWIDTSKFRRALPDESLYVDVVRLSNRWFAPIAESEQSEHYVAWIVPPHGKEKIVILDLGACEAIDKAIVQARTSLANATDKEGPLRMQGEAAASAAMQKNLQAVADFVLKPLLPHLSDKKQLILSPDGALWLLPWAALPVDKNKCLLEQCSIRYVNSGRELVKQAGHSKLTTNAPAIVVNPDYDLTGAAAKTALRAVLPEFKFDENASLSETSRSRLPHIARLPFTPFEGRAALSSLEHLTKLKPVFYEQENALETVVKKFQRPKHLLLSTHGFFLPDQDVKRDDKPELLASTESKTRSVALTTDDKPVENPLLRCGLLFAGCNSPRESGLDDGILTGMEIVGMDLRGTELVVLSACETGVGKIRNGEGVAGLRQAFQLAGAQSVVSTLWQVPDHDSALIMQDFFANLAAGQSKAEALRNAQLKRIAARKAKSGAAHPYFWAAWTVTGE